MAVLEPPNPDDDLPVNIEQLRADLAPYPSYRDTVLQENIRYLESLINLPCTQLNPRLVEDIENEN
jgi:hypothetical protein